MSHTVLKLPFVTGPPLGNWDGATLGETVCQVGPERELKEASLAVLEASITYTEASMEASKAHMQDVKALDSMRAMEPFMESSIDFHGKRRNSEVERACPFHGSVAYVQDGVEDTARVFTHQADHIASEASLDSPALAEH